MSVLKMEFDWRKARRETNQELTIEERKNLNKLEKFLIDFGAKCSYCKNPIEKDSIYVNKKPETSIEAFFNIKGLPKRDISFLCFNEENDCDFAGSLYTIIRRLFDTDYDDNLPDLYEEEDSR